MDASKPVATLTTDRNEGRAMASKPILAGYRIIDFTQYLAGPSATRLMAEMGAEIIKVEMAPFGDPSRAFPYRKHKRSTSNQSSYYLLSNKFTI